MITKISMSSDGSQMVAVASSNGYIMIREPGTSTTITTMTNTTTTSTRTAVISVDEPGTARWYAYQSYQLKTTVTHNKKLDGAWWGNESTYMTNGHRLVENVWSDALLKAEIAMNKAHF